MIEPSALTPFLGPRLTPLSVLGTGPSRYWLGPFSVGVPAPLPTLSNQSVHNGHFRNGEVGHRTDNVIMGRYDWLALT
jgi:hypothetical protein